MTARRLTTRDVGAVVSLDHSSVARWLKGAEPRRQAAQQLADYFGVTVEDLLDDRRALPGVPLPSPTSGPGGAKVIREGVTPAPVAAEKSGERPRDGLPRSRQEDHSVTAQLLATLQAVQQQLATQSQQIADLTAHLKSHGLHPPDPKGKGKG